jgi:hypothetical protein
MKTELSPAAQAVKDAALSMYDDGIVRKIAWPLDMPVVTAALRAAANRVEDLIPDLGSARFSQGVETSAAFLESIATELENNNA